MDRNIQHTRPHEDVHGPEISGTEARQGVWRFFTMRVMVISLILAGIIGAILWMSMNGYTTRDEQPLENAPVESTPPAVPQNNAN